MAISLKKLFEPAQLTTSLVTYYTLAEASTTVLENLVIRLVNTTASAVTIDANVVPEAGSASNTNAIVSQASIPARDFLLVSVPAMKYGDFLQAKASAGTAVSIHHESGMPKTP